jgi:hypothetical protein
LGRQEGRSSEGGTSHFKEGCRKESSLSVQLTASANAVARPYSVLAITGSEQDVLPNGLVLQ